MTDRNELSDPSVTMQNPFDWPLALFSKNLMSKTSLTPTELIASVTSWSVVHHVKLPMYIPTRFAGARWLLGP